MLEKSFEDHFNSYRESFPEFLQRLREDPGHRWDHWWLAFVEVDGQQEPAGAVVSTVLPENSRRPRGQLRRLHRRPPQRPRPRRRQGAAAHRDRRRGASAAATGWAWRSTPTRRPGPTGSTTRWAGRPTTSPSRGSRRSSPADRVRGDGGLGCERCAVTNIERRRTGRPPGRATATGSTTPSGSGSSPTASSTCCSAGSRSSWRSVTSKNASTKGALQTLREQPFGGVLVWAVAVGMFLLVVWRVIEAAFGHREESDDNKRLRKRVIAGARPSSTARSAVSAVKVATGSVAPPAAAPRG